MGNQTSLKTSQRGVATPSTFPLDPPLITHLCEGLTVELTDQRVLGTLFSDIFAPLAGQKYTCHVPVIKIITVQLLKPGHLKEDYLITTFFGKQKILNFFCNWPITFMNLMAVF